MRRRLFGFLTLLSLLLAIAAVGMTVRGVFANDFFGNYFGNSIGVIEYDFWAVRIGRLHLPDPDLLQSERFPGPGFVPSKLLPRLSSSAHAEFVWIQIPHWLTFVVSLPFPILWLRRGRRVKRSALIGLCSKCGYDLRASTGRCPECGTAIDASTPQPA